MTEKKLNVLALTVEPLGIRLTACLLRLHQINLVMKDSCPVLGELEEQGRLYELFLIRVKNGFITVSPDYFQTVKLIEAFCMLIESEFHPQDNEVSIYEP